eukprot:scaffold500421_cov31-Prasinocladus_malaysianus.AAC.2
MRPGFRPLSVHKTQDHKRLSDKCPSGDPDPAACLAGWEHDNPALPQQFDILMPQQLFRAPGVCCLPGRWS